MRFRERVGLSVPPVLLRLALAAVFLWAGLGKMQATEFGPEQAATLASLGVSVRANAPQSPDAGGEATAEGAEDGPAAALPGYPGARVVLAQESQPQEPQESEEQSAQQGQSEDQPADDPPAADDQTEPPTADDAGSDDEASAAEPNAFPNGGRALGLHNVTLMVHDASSTAGGNAALLPTALNARPWPYVLGWAAAITEVVGAACVLVGLLTRICALALGGVMVMALWLTQIGPVVIAGQPGFLGFLPPLAEFESWKTMLFQFVILMSALGVFFLGPGPLAIDRFLFGGPRAEHEVLTDPGE